MSNSPSKEEAERIIKWLNTYRQRVLDLYKNQYISCYTYRMDLPLNKELNSNIENVEKMAQIVDDEDVRLFLVNKPKTNKKNTANFGKYYYPKENIAEYFKSNYKQDIDARKIEKFLENGILDNILFNFMLSR
ncbi:MAG: hypothetical protein AAGF26_04860, partial [Cyanobacteria bacterium P01_G01_bin.49]